MPPTRERSGVVLAGGRGRRMGADKALLEVGGRRLVDRAVATLREVCDDVVVARGACPPISGLDAAQVPDAVEGAGPLGGLVAGLEAARREAVAVLAVDLLRPDADLLRRLLDGLGDREAVVPVVDGRSQPLHAVYARRAAPALRARLSGEDRSLLGALEALDVAFVPVEGVPDPGIADDADEPGDLAGQ